MFCVFDNFSLILTMQVFDLAVPLEVLKIEYPYNHIYEPLRTKKKMNPTVDI